MFWDSGCLSQVLQNRFELIPVPFRQNHCKTDSNSIQNNRNQYLKQGRPFPQSLFVSNQGGCELIRGLQYNAIYIYIHTLYLIVYTIRHFVSCSNIYIYIYINTTVVGFTYMVLFVFSPQFAMFVLTCWVVRRTQTTGDHLFLFTVERSKQSMESRFGCANLHGKIHYQYSGSCWTKPSQSLQDHQLQYFPTCQVRVVRFYVSCPCSSPCPSFSSSASSSPVFASCGQRRTSTGSSRLQWAAPDLNRGAPDCSGQRRTSPGELPSGVGSAGPQLPQDMSKDMSEMCQPRMSEDMSKEMSEMCQPRISEDMSKEMSKMCQKRMSERIPEDMPEDMSEDMSEEMSEEMSEDMSIEMSDKMSEKNVRRNVRRYAKRYVRNVSDKKFRRYVRRNVR